MKKLLVILAAIGIPMMLWSQNPTHTLTIEYTKAQVTVNGQAKPLSKATTWLIL